MLDTHKLIYILPEVVYIAEMLPGKKQHSFTIHNFRQINGEFLKNDELIVKNILKLFSKVDPDKYHFILPDSLFTNTIVTTTEAGEAKIKKYVSETLLPSLDISNETHFVETFVLTEFKGVAKVQLSALEKEVVAPLRAAAAQYDIKINGVSPLSWTIKSVVSLEPSVTVLQIGSQIYTALQYIGVDQATITPVEELDVVSETIKTLKGSEPSIQTVYLLTNAVVEKSLKESLNSILPLQQLADFSEEDTKMPSYVRQIIESGMKTLEINDYPVPKFELGKATEADMSTYVAGNLDSVSKDEEETEEVSSALPAPTPAAAIAAPVPPIALDEPEEPELLEDGEEEAEAEELETNEDESPEIADDEINDVEADELEVASLENEDTETIEDANETELEEPELADDSIEDELEEIEEPEGEVEHVKKVPEKPSIEDLADEDELENVVPVKPEAIASPAVTAPLAAASVTQPVAKTPVNDVDLSQFAQNSSTNQPSMQNQTPVQQDKPVIKNQSGVGNMVKMLLVTLVVFAITVAVGVGVGLGILTLTNKQGNDDVSTVEISPAPTTTTVAEPSPTPEASPAAEIDRTELDILIVNATNKAGYAGTFKAKLDAKDYKSAKTGNAKGDYETGNYVLMEEENAALVAALSEDLGLELEYQAEGYDTEDATGANSAVVVLAE